jgi:hypothetical protein
MSKKKPTFALGKHGLAKRSGTLKRVGRTWREPSPVVVKRVPSEETK